MEARKSIHVSEQSHAALNRISKMYSIDMKRLLDFIVQKSASEIEESPEIIKQIFEKIKVSVEQPSFPQIVDGLFTKSAFFGLDYIFQEEVHKSVGKLANGIDLISAMERLGYKKYFPGDDVKKLAWKKN